MENRETPAPMSATDMTAKLFRAMSKASWDQVRCLYLVAFAGMFADQQPEPEPYRDRTYADAFGRPGGMEEDLYNA